jgi:transcriptional regulator with XRE-family HTH domain
VQLAEQAGIGQGLVSRWLRGSWPAAPHLPLIAAALGWSVDYLLTGAEATRPLDRPTIDALLTDVLAREARGAAGRRGPKRRPA